MRKIILSFFIVLSFVMIRVDRDKIWLYIPGEYTSGSDSSCEKYVKELSTYKNLYKEIYIVNHGWIPGPKVIKR
jgi:ABC-type cobalt transport system substrate-binding protein